MASFPTHEGARIRFVQLSQDTAFVRLWQGFMTARAAIALVLLLMTSSLYALGPTVHSTMVVACAGYLISAVAVRALARPRKPGSAFDPQWVFTIGVDVLLFSMLQFLQVGGINYTPLLALPVLLAAVMGSALLALATAAGVTLLLLAEAWVSWLQPQSEAAARFLQSGLTGLGFFAVALLANQLATRLAREEDEARRSQQAAVMQTRVNELVIESLADGVLVVDANGMVRAANPASYRMLGEHAGATPFALSAQPIWLELVQMAQQTFADRRAQEAAITIEIQDKGIRHMQVSSRLTSPGAKDEESLCVMFLQDSRELEARLRTEKLAAMGRMSAAVAHEIRNPLAAIMQANALLDEDIHDPIHKRLTQMVSQNAQRLASIVEEILNVARVQQQGTETTAQQLALDDTVVRTCADWASQTSAGARLAVLTNCHGLSVPFEGDHLRRVLINLLDNALRYCGTQPDSICVTTAATETGEPCLGVWSDGDPLEQSVQQHLFEPFFSSESRSSGLGLYICRELCARHGASIAYQRTPRYTPAGSRYGNQFSVTFRAPLAPSQRSASLDTITT